MAVCLSYTPDPLPHKISLLNSTTKLKFGSQEALFLLRKCRNFDQLKIIHARIIRHGLSNDQLLVRKLLDLCSSYGKTNYSLLVFNQIQCPHVFTWNLMIRSLTISGSSQQALTLYNLMICNGFKPDKFTFPFVIKACIVSLAIEKGKEVHGFAVKAGFSRDMFVQNTLMDLYFRCGDIYSGRKVFDKMRVRSVVSWTTLISGLVASGDLNAARGVFERMRMRNVVSWTAMINAYVMNDKPQEAFELFQRMLRANVRPNGFTLVSLLQACTELGSLKLGGWIHDFALKNGFEIGVYLGTALIDMYSKCGSLEEAKKVFNKLEVRNLATWNSMITSLGVHGHGEEALSLFAQMEKANVQPDAITFVGVLCACVHTKNINEGYRYFRYMREHYGISPIVEHYSCLIDLYNRANMNDDVSEELNAIPEDLNKRTAVELLKLNSMPEELNKNIQFLRMNNQQEKLNVNAAAALLSIVDNVANADKISNPLAEESHFLGVSTCYFPQNMLCFKWDEG